MLREYALLADGYRGAGNLPLTGYVGRRDAEFAHAVLCGLTRPGGGMVAAATTSSPERARAGRNYDYRYAWIRDQCYAVLAGAAAGVDDLLDAAVDFVHARLLADGPTMAPAYTASGGPVPDQSALPHLAGYPGGEVRVGNWVGRQFQLDIFGESLLLLAAAHRRQRLDVTAWRAVEVAVTAAAPARQAARWAGLADAILAEVGRSGVHPSGRWQRSDSDPRVDAALPTVRGALPPDDPRSRATRHAVLVELANDGYLYRFRPDERPLGDAKGAFLLCGFIASLAAHQAGDETDAHRWFATGRRVARRASTPRSTTCYSGSCAAICRRRSYTPHCWRRQQPCTAPAGDRTGRRAIWIMRRERNVSARFPAAGNGADDAMAHDGAGEPAVTVTPYEDGPLIIRGDFELRTPSGAIIDPGRATVALCRCGKSAIRPFCDGTHRLIGFRAGAEPDPEPHGRNRLRTDPAQ